MLEWDGCGEDVSPWGKVGAQRPVTAYPLLFHLLDTAVVAQELWDRFLTANQRAVIAAGLGVSEADARVVVAFWAGLHDLGKLTPGFQQCVSEAYAGLSKVLRDDVGEVDGMRHDRASMHSALSPLSDLGYAADGNRDPGVRVAQILGGHHGRFQPMDLARLQALARPGVDDGLGGQQWRQLRKDYIGVVNSLLGVPVVPQRVTAPSAVLITGLVILADWLVSQEHYWRPWAGGAVIGAAEHFARAGTAAPGLVADAGLVRVELTRKGFAQLHGIERPNPLQASIMEELPGAVAGAGAGILVVTAATGDGKTETALEAERVLAQAAGTSGLCFVLPTMATSDEMYKRVAAVVAAQVRPDAGAAVTLTHSMAWLNTAYSDEDLAAAGDDVVSDGESAPGGGVRGTLPGRWLRGAKRPLLAQFAVGTIDQSLLGILPVRHNALRLLALSGKTFVVDEAHAYDPYMQVLLCRLLQWLGSYNCPVVLLSATLPSSVGERLVRAYLEGGKQVNATVLGQMPFRPPYPGWLFVDASGRSTAISQGRQEEQSAERRYRLRVDVRRVRHLPEPRDGSSLPGDARLAVLEEVLDPLVAGRGCAAVVCTTVADAQETYAFLKRRFALKAGEEIVLLHARFPGDQREQVTRMVVEALGRTGRRPERMVVVATQVIEQSLDLDADLVVSDLAPLAQLLQRAGRCWRHEQAWSRGGQPRERPAWTAGGPRLVVLDPLGKERVPPRHWGTVYPHYLLSATSDCLHALANQVRQHDGEPGRPTIQPQHPWIDIPGDVQTLVEEVHGTESRFEAETAILQTQLTEHQAETMAQQHIGEWAAVPGPWHVGGLHDLHRETLDEVEATTRLGAESVRILGCYRQPDGRTSLDPQGEHPLPQPTAGRFSAKDVRAVMRRTLPVRADLFKGRTAEQDAPTSWRKHPLLGDLLLLIHPVVDGLVEGVRIGSSIFRLDPELGLVLLRD